MEESQLVSFFVFFLLGMLKLSEPLLFHILSLLWHIVYM